MGMSMKVERSTLDQVKKRFESNKKKLEEKKKQYDFEERMKELKEDVSKTITITRVAPLLIVLSWKKFSRTFVVVVVVVLYLLVNTKANNKKYINT